MLMAHNIHDLTFKQLISRRQFFIDFCQTYVPPEILVKLNFGACHLFKLEGETVNQSHHGSQLHHREIADVVYQVQMQGANQDALIIFHIEHFSSPKANTSLRSANYNLNTLVQYNEINPKKPLPLLIPIIYYHGKRSPFPYSLNIYDLFEENKALAEQYLLTPLLIDVHQFSDAALAKHQGISAAELAFKYTTLRKQLPSARIKLLVEQLIQLDYNLRHTVLRYSINRLVGNRDDFVARYLKALPQEESTMRTMAEEWVHEGMEKGMEKVAKVMLANNEPLAKIVSYTQLSESRLKALA